MKSLPLAISLLLLVYVGEAWMVHVSVEGPLATGWPIGENTISPPFISLVGDIGLQKGCTTTTWAGPVPTLGTPVSRSIYSNCQGPQFFAFVGTHF